MNDIYENTPCDNEITEVVNTRVRNTQIKMDLADELSECIANARSLASVAVTSDFENYQAKVMHDYWGAMSSLLSRAEDLCEALTNNR